MQFYKRLSFLLTCLNSNVSQGVSYQEIPFRYSKLFSNTCLGAILWILDMWIIIRLNVRPISFKLNWLKKRRKLLTWCCWMTMKCCLRTLKSDTTSKPSEQRRFQIIDTPGWKKMEPGGAPGRAHSLETPYLSCWAHKERRFLHVQFLAGWMFSLITSWGFKWPHMHVRFFHAYRLVWKRQGKNSPCSSPTLNLRKYMQSGISLLDHHLWRTNKWNV